MWTRHLWLEWLTKRFLPHIVPEDRRESQPQLLAEQNDRPREDRKRPLGFGGSLKWRNNRKRQIWQLLRYLEGKFNFLALLKDKSMWIIPLYGCAPKVFSGTNYIFHMHSKQIMEEISLQSTSKFKLLLSLVSCCGVILNSIFKMQLKKILLRYRIYQLKWTRQEPEYMETRMDYFFVIEGINCFTY